MASHARAFSSFQCTANAVAVEWTVIGPGFTPATSTDRVCARAAGATARARRDKLRRNMMESRLRLYTGLEGNRECESAFA